MLPLPGVASSRSPRWLLPLPSCPASQPCAAGHTSQCACPADVSGPADSTPTGMCGSHGLHPVADQPSEQLPGTDQLPRESDVEIREESNEPWALKPEDSAKWGWGHHRTPQAEEGGGSKGTREKHP